MGFALAGVFVVGLAAVGAVLDRSAQLSQPLLFGALQLASLGAVLLVSLALARRPAFQSSRLALVLAALLAWRLAYFPIMVFSGHLASIAEWLALRGGLPVLVFPVFLLCVAAGHGLSSLAAAGMLRPPHRLLRLAIAPAFLVAGAVSFSQWEDLALLPDRAWRLDAPVPAAREARRNPYLPALVAPGYRPHQRVMLLAAGLTYETIPESPWGRTVKAVLEGDFDTNPKGSTQDRVVEHYLAYHSAQAWLGCRDLAECPTPHADVAAPAR